MRPTKGKFKKRVRFAWLYSASNATLKSVARHTKVGHMTMRSKLQLIKDVQAGPVMTDYHINQPRRSTKSTSHNLYLQYKAGDYHPVLGDIH